MTASTLVMFTGSYPYPPAAETTFVGPELAFLVKRFDDVVLVPEALGGTPVSLPAGARLDESYAAALAGLGRGPTLRAALASGLVPREIFSHPASWMHRAARRRLVAFAARAETARRWIDDFARGRPPGSILFYSYWLGTPTMGAVLARRRVVSRAHGVDLYEDRHAPAYLPCRGMLLAGLSRLFLISEHGRQYVSRRYPRAADRCEVSRMGVDEAKALARPSADGVTRIVSCSSVSRVKRLDRLLAGLVRAAEQRPLRQIEWTHFGDGPLFEDIQDQARRVPVNLRCRLAGAIGNAEVLATYRGHPVDVFINTSESEGIPVSVMEALAHGIPVIAPEVGGVPELVSAATGLRLPTAPGTDDVANAILSVIDEPALFQQKKTAAHECAARLVSASTNYGLFTERLSVIAGMPEGSGA